MSKPDVPMLFRRLDAYVYALAEVAFSATTTEFPGPVKECIAVLQEDIEKVSAEIQRALAPKRAS